MDNYSKEIKGKEKDYSPQKELDGHQRLKEKEEKIDKIKQSRITKIWDEFVGEADTVSTERQANRAAH